MGDTHEKTRNKLAPVLKGAALTLSLAAACALPMACGGGGGGGDATGGAVRSVGVITAKGSITVNGVKYETDTSSIVNNGTLSDDAGLQVGMVVEVTGTINDDGVTGRANSVDYDDNIQGFIIDVPDAQSGTFNVLGRTVRTDAATRFKGEDSQSLTFADLQAGDHVEISGRIEAGGDIVATYVEHELDGDQEITDIIDAIDSATAFRIGSLTVDHAGARIEDFPQGSAPAVGDRVEVKVGSFDLATMTLTASSVELKSGFDDSDHSSDTPHFEAEGTVVSLDGDNLVVTTFRGETINATLSSGTRFEDGTRTGLVAGVRVEVEGQMSGGVLLASKVGFED